MELKPCPFCGMNVAHLGTIAEHKYSDVDSASYDYDVTHYDVVCDAVNGGCGSSTGLMYETPEAAAESWNRRAKVEDIENVPVVDAVEVVRCRECIGKYTPYECGLDDALSYLDEQPTIEQPKWISCAERLPNPHEDVLVYDKTADAVTCACLSFCEEWFDVPIKNEVTHWMPLPQPPKGDE